MSFIESFDYLIEKFSAMSDRKKKYYDDLKKDPKKWKHYLEKARQRGQKRRSKLTDEYIEKRKDLKTLKFLSKEKSLIDKEYQSCYSKKYG